MSGSLNRVMLIGRLTRDPEMRFTPSGQPVTNFSIATNRYQSDPNGGQAREFTDYHNCVAWNFGNRKLAEIIGQNVKKGSLVYVEGRLQTSTWEKDGQKHYKTEINVNDIQFLEPKGSESEAGNEPAVDPDAVPDFA